MKKAALILLTFGMFNTISAQEITGDWHGFLKEFQLRVVFHIEKTDDGFSATLDSPDQGAKGIPVAETLFENDTLTIRATSIGASYTGAFGKDGFEGTFSQGGMQIPLKLMRQAMEKAAANRPQEPKEPYPYASEEVTFQNKNANVTLAGTLTLPQKSGMFPAVVLISGSGPQDRNEELAGHKPFLVIADHLTKNGIAVLRYDDRGFGQSTGNFESATSVDFASDVESAVAYLQTRKEIDPAKIGLIGHSEGGLVAPMVASNSKDVDFIILLAGPGLRGDKILLLQQELIARASGTTETEIQSSREINAKVFEMVLKSADVETLKTDLTNYLNQALTDSENTIISKGSSVPEFVSTAVNHMTTPWMVYFMKHDPVPILEQVDCAVLAVNGEKDLQVPPKENLAAIRNALAKGGNKKVTVQEFPNLNHLFQECETGSPSEYGTIEQTFSPKALAVISDWILEKVK